MSKKTKKQIFVQVMYTNDATSYITQDVEYMHAKSAPTLKHETWILMHSMVLQIFHRRKWLYEYK